MEELRFLTAETAEKVRQQFGTPCYVYDEASLRANAAKATAFPNAYGASPCPPTRDVLPAARLARGEHAHVDERPALEEDGAHGARPHARLLQL